MQKPIYAITQKYWAAPKNQGSCIQSLENTGVYLHKILKRYLLSGTGAVMFYGGSYLILNYPALPMIRITAAEEGILWAGSEAPILRMLKLSTVSPSARFQKCLVA